MPSPTVKYLSFEDFTVLLFEVIQEQLNYDPNDPLPDYRKENSQSLEKVLTLVQNDSYYPTVVGKAAYLFVSIIEGHIYSNGNKRLGLVTLLYFLIINRLTVKVAVGELSDLCLYIADKERNNNATFEQLKLFAEKFLKERMIPFNAEQAVTS